METANNDETKKKDADVPGSSRAFAIRIREVRKNLKKEYSQESGKEREGVIV
jgi:hypothetical protein